MKDTRCTYVKGSCVFIMVKTRPPALRISMHMACMPPAVDTFSSMRPSATASAMSAATQLYTVRQEGMPSRSAARMSAHSSGVTRPMT